MNKFEYATVELMWEGKEEPYEITLLIDVFDKLGSSKQNCVRTGIKTKARNPLEVIKEDGSTYFLRIASLLRFMSIQFAQMGFLGWEVCDYKFSTGDSYFVQALLKRRIQ